MNNDLNNFTGGDAERVQHQASQFDPDQVATIQWLGYDTPEGASALSASDAEPGAEDLPQFVAGVRAARPERLHWTVIGHSYGSLVTGMALSEQGLEVDETVLIGSPGVGVELRRRARRRQRLGRPRALRPRRLLRVARAQPARQGLRRHPLPHRRHLGPLELLQRGLGVTAQHRPDRRRVPGRGERERWLLLGTWRSGSPGSRWPPAAGAAATPTAPAATSQLARAERSLQGELEAAVEHLGLPAEDGRARRADALRRPRARRRHERLPAAAEAGRRRHRGAAAPGRRLLARARPPGARGRRQGQPSRRCSRPPTRAGRSRSSSSPSAARRCSPAARPACPTPGRERGRRYPGAGGRTRPGRAPDHLRHVEHRRAARRRRLRQGLARGARDRRRRPRLQRPAGADGRDRAARRARRSCSTATSTSSPAGPSSSSRASRATA